MTNPYAKEVQKFIDGVPDGLEMVNLGSTFSKFGFNYNYFDKKGFNFAVQPQPLTYDYRILKQYAHKISKGALVVIVVVCPFGFAVDYYPDDASNYKYYSFLDTNEIKRYGLLKDYAVKHFPLIVRYTSFGFIKRAFKKALKICGLQRTDIRHKDSRINHWMCEFDLHDLSDGRQADKLSSVFSNTVESLKKILTICHENDFKPVIISMPAVKSQSGEFSAEFIERFYTSNLKLANIYGAPVIDYYGDDRFNDSSLYENGADCFNNKGRKYFAEVFAEDLDKKGIYELNKQHIKPSVPFQKIKDGAVCFGTNITIQTFFGNGALGFAKVVAQYVKKFIKRSRSADWGKTATLKATRCLAPCVKEAVKAGITVFDCSRAYGGSERRLAMALKDVKRESVFLITKIDDRSQFMGTVEQCFDESLRQLSTDYVDLLLLHWPVNYSKTGDARIDESVPVYVRSWKVLEDIYKSGKAKAIGVANFSVKQLETLKIYAEIMPMANEFECHPLCIRKDLNDYCTQNGIKVFAYAALCAMDRRLMNDSMGAIAARHGKTIAQIILKWHVQCGRIPIFGTTKPERVQEYSSLDFTLTDEEINIINDQNINYRAFPDSERCDFTRGIWLGWERYKDCCP